MKKEEILKPPKRIRVKAHCFIDGIRTVNGEQRRLGPGLYVLGRNLSESEAIRLSQPDLAHAVETLEDRRPDEALASDTPAPEPTPGYLYEKEKFSRDMQAKIDAEFQRQKKLKGKSRNEK